MSFDRFSGPVWSLFRIVIGLLFLCHGAAGVFGLFGGHRGSGDALPVGSWPNWWAALIQLVGGALVLAGLATRPAALVASGSMAYAYFVVHQPDGLLPLNNGGVTAALYAWAFLVIAVLGAGPWSVDGLLGWRRVGEAAAPDASIPAGRVRDTA